MDTKLASRMNAIEHDLVTMLGTVLETIEAMERCAAAADGIAERTVAAQCDAAQAAALFRQLSDENRNAAQQLSDVLRRVIAAAAMAQPGA